MGILICLPLVITPSLSATSNRRLAKRVGTCLRVRDSRRSPYTSAQAQQRDARPGINSRDFNSQAEAQQYLRENQDDSDVLDNDPGGRDGIACETYPHTNPARDEVPVVYDGNDDISPPANESTTAPPPSPSPFPPPRPTLQPQPLPSDDDRGTVMKAGGTTNGPVPLMPDGSCPPEYPAKQASVCYQ